MKIKGIILDVGGVLVQTINTSKHRVWERKLHLSQGQLLKEVYSLGLGNSATIGRVSSEYIWQNIKKRFILTTQELIQLQTDFYAGNKLNTGFYNYIKHIREKCKIVILSDAWDDARTIYIKKYHLDKIVDKMILSAEEGMRKPDDRFIKIALRYLDTSPAETLYVDDKLKYILQAKSLCLHTVLFTDTASAITTIESYL